jgi:hypothetical protein
MADGPAIPLDPQLVIKTVADCYGQTVDDLYSMRRWHPLPDARRVLYALVHEQCRVSWGQTAVLTGRARTSASFVAGCAGAANPHALDLVRGRLVDNGQMRLDGI